jgi:hypothetical protein
MQTSPIGLRRLAEFEFRLANFLVLFVVVSLWPIYIAVEIGVLAACSSCLLSLSVRPFCLLPVLPIDVLPINPIFQVRIILLEVFNSTAHADTDAGIKLGINTPLI